MLDAWKKGTVVKIINETKDTKRFWISADEIQSFDFQPGQFVTLDLPIHEQKNKRWRSYSIASTPTKTNVFELIVVLQQDGLGTHYLFNDITVGSEIIFRGPVGKFTLPEKIDTDIFFICTGTGIAPFRSMINYILEKNLPHKNLHLIFGCRTFEDVLYKDELEELQKKIPTFHFHIVFSRESSVESNQNFYTGYVHKVYEKLVAERPKPVLFYLCGWQKMIDEAKQRIITLGYDKKDIHLELYG